MSAAEESFLRARPASEYSPCAQCGKRVDRLRAPSVSAFDEGMRFFCSKTCAAEYVETRPRSSTLPRQTRPSSVPEQVREATLPRIELGETVDDDASPGLVMEPLPLAGMTLPIVAFLLATLGDSLITAIGSATATCLAGAMALAVGKHIRAELGSVAWLASPFGAMLAALAGLAQEIERGNASWALAGAAIASFAVLFRFWLDSRTRLPVQQLLGHLRSHLPARARIPDPKGEDGRYLEVPASQVGAGQEVLVVEGEALAADGVIIGGEARVLLHIGATQVHTRKQGDPLLAGARVVSGAIRVLATRVGEERAALRVAGFGEFRPDGARIVKLATQATRWGGVAALGASLGGLALTGAPGVAGALASAGAVLLAAPLLAGRRTTEGPLVAAAAAAAARGVAFRDGKGLEDAGRVTTCAFCMSGTVTEGLPAVIDVKHARDPKEMHRVLELAGGAERMLDSAGPIGEAIISYAKDREIKLERMRRATYQAGRGVSAITMERTPVLVGNRQLLLEAGVSIAAAEELAGQAERRGESTIFVSHDDRLEGFLVLRDAVRAGARAAVQRLFDQDIEVVLLSGDHRTSVVSLAKQLDVAHVKAELGPVERGHEVARLSAAGTRVACVGAPSIDPDALVAARVPVALRAAGDSEVSHAIALSGDDVRDAASALWMARAARTEAVRGVFVAIGLGAALMTGAAFGWIPPAGAALATLALDAFALPAGSRLLERIQRRVPSQ